MRIGTEVPRRRYGAIAVLALGTAVALGACGGGSSSKTSSTSAAQRAAATNQAMAAYRQCLRDHGATSVPGAPGGTAGTGVPDSGTPPSSRAPLTPDQQAKRRAAQQACQSKLPPGYLQQRQQDLAAYRSCLRDHGVNLPANPSGGGSGLRGVNRNDPTFQAAQKVCAPLMPSGGGFGPGVGGGSPSSSVPPSSALGTAMRSTV
jgi:hypothetical protein